MKNPCNLTPDPELSIRHGKTFLLLAEKKRHNGAQKIQ
jgi:hypothetical protein